MASREAMFSKVTKVVKRFDIGGIYPLFFTLIFILILIQYSFSTQDAIFYDYWVKMDFDSSFNKEVIVISLDEESDEFLGEVYPYTYATHDRFLDKLLKDQPAIVNHLVHFNDPDSEVESRYFENVKEHLKNYTSAGGKFRFGTTAREGVGDYIHPDEVVPPLGLREFGYGLAILNQDGDIFARDNITRRGILNVSGEDTLHLWTANQWQEKTGLPILESQDYQGSVYQRDADALFAMFRYKGSPIEGENTYTTIPFHKVLVGNFPKGFFQDKIVLIGPKYISDVSNFGYAPHNRAQTKSPNLYIHAALIVSLIKDATVIELPDLVTDILAVLISVFLSFVISKIQPTKGLILTIGLMATIFAMAYLSFALFGVWVKLSHLILSIFVVYYIWVPFRAIAEYQTRYAIEEETKLLKQVDNLKQNFISLMSHDLKTPVAKIAGIADNLKHSLEIGPKQKEMLESITLSTKELNNFINSILDLTKIESQKFEINKTTKDVNQIIEVVAEKLKYEAEEKKINLELVLSPLYPVEIDVILMNRVISNLVENAIKYCPEASAITIRSYDDDKWVYIEIKDNGPGIGPEDLAHIFDKFYRVKNDSVHKIKGSGLGLYLVKYFVELQGGEISVESTLGKGTKFIVRLKNQ